MKLALVWLALLLLGTTAWAAYGEGAMMTSTRINLGLGAGLMYGEIGTNVEYHVTQAVSVTAGIGLNGESNWFAGGRYYLKPEGKGPRSRITLGLGTLERDGGDRQLIRPYFAVGGSWANAESDFSGWDVDLTTNGRISLGYHF
jgi:hypothetical protein